MRAALWLLLASLCAQASAQDDAACPYVAYRPKRMGFLRLQLPLNPLSPELCRRMDALKRRFEAMLPAAQRLAEREARGRPLRFPLDRLSLTDWLPSQWEDNGRYRPWDREVEFDLELLKSTLQDDAAANYVLGHEIAHGVQHALGLERPGCDQSYEAQADLWGLAIARETGLLDVPAGKALLGRHGRRELEFDASAYQRSHASSPDAAACSRTHPIAPDRVLNALLADAARLLEPGAAAGAFDGARASGPPPAAESGTARAASPPMPGFTRQGRLIVSSPILPPPASASGPPAPPLSPAAELARLALYEAGNRTGWTSAQVRLVLTAGLSAGARGLDETIRAALSRLSASEAALALTLEALGREGRE